MRLQRRSRGIDCGFQLWLDSGAGAEPFKLCGVVAGWQLRCG